MRRHAPGDEAKPASMLAVEREVYRREGGRGMLPATYEEDVKVRAEPFDAVELDLAAIWAR